MDQKWHDRSYFCKNFNVIKTFTINMLTKNHVFARTILTSFFNTLLNTFNEFFDVENGIMNYGAFKNT